MYYWSVLSINYSTYRGDLYIHYINIVRREEINGKWNV